MTNYFIPISELKNKAKHEVQLHLRNLNRSTKLLNSIMGSPATNKNWLLSAENSYKKSKQFQGEKKRIALLNALFDAYKCDYRMQNSLHNDAQIPELKNRIETAYINEILSFIEQNIYDEDFAQKHLTTLKAAIRVLSEKNSKLAKSFAEILNQTESLKQTLEKLDDFFNLPVDDIATRDIIRIKGFLQMHRSRIRKNPYLQDSIYNRLHDKLAEIHSYYKNLIEEENESALPSLRKLYKYHDEFEKTYRHFKSITHENKYHSMIKQKQKLETLIQLLDKFYPQFVKTYKYLSYPRQQIDVKRITNEALQLDSYTQEINLEYDELFSLSPSLEDIKERFEATLSLFYKDDLIQYYRYYNELMNTSESEAKIDDMILFLNYLNTQLKEANRIDYVTTKIEKMKHTVQTELYAIFQNKIQTEIHNNVSTTKVRNAFDSVFHKLTELTDIETIEILQEMKREYFRNPSAEFEFSLTDKNKTQDTELEEKMELPIAEIADDFVDDIQPNFPRLVILDNYSIQNIVLFTQPKIQVGRQSQNDIILRCPWVSSQHCTLDFTDFILEDLASTNGTFVGNRRLKNGLLTKISTFSIANAFDFGITPFRISFAFYLTAVKNKKLLDDTENKDYLQSLLNTKFVWLAEGDYVDLNPENGHLFLGNIQDNMLRIERKNNRFYLTDLKKQIYQKLIHAEGNELHERFAFQIL